MKIKGQHGVSLIEILISITISLFLLGGVLQAFLNNKQAYRISSAFGELQENGRFLSDYLPRVIRMSGYRTPPVDTMFATTDTLYPSASSHIQVVDNLGENGSDIITVRYQGSGDGAGNPDGTVRDCLNQSIDSNTIALSVFSINANDELVCQATNPNAPTNVSTEILVPGVENIQVLFGEDVDNDRSADRYVSANFAGINLNNVVSIRLSILLKSTNEIYKTIDNNSYNLLGTVYSPTPDYRIRKPMVFTIFLRNVASNL